MEMNLLNMDILSRLDDDLGCGSGVNGPGRTGGA
jgi:hypothetical protein